jgi:hypothetical protein
MSVNKNEPGNHSPGSHRARRALTSFARGLGCEEIVNALY